MHMFYIVRFIIPKKVKYVDLYSASSRSASNCTTASRKSALISAPQANPTARHQPTLRDHVICLFTPPATHSSLGRLRLSRPGCLVPPRGGLPVQRPNRA